MFSVVYLLVRRLLGCLMVLARGEVSKDAELLVWGSITRSRLGGLPGGDHRRVIQVVYLLARCLLGCLTVLARGEVSKDAELLVLGMRTWCCGVRSAGSATSRATGCGSRRCPGWSPGIAGERCSL